jgi:hypothetical protein
MYVELSAQISDSVVGLAGLLRRMGKAAAVIPVGRTPLSAHIGGRR